MQGLRITARPFVYLLDHFSLPLLTRVSCALCDGCHERMRSAVCGLRSAVCGLRSAVCGLRSAVCGLRSAVCGLRSAVCNSKRHRPLSCKERCRFNVGRRQWLLPSVHHRHYGAIGVTRLCEVITPLRSNSKMTDSLVLFWGAERNVCV